MKMMRVTTWAREYFDPPLAKHTYRNLVISGEVPAKKVGRYWYVDVDAWEEQVSGRMTKLVREARA
jgi:hypothetical protein